MKIKEFSGAKPQIEVTKIEFDKFQMHKLLTYAHKIPKNHLTTNGDRW